MEQWRKNLYTMMITQICCMIGFGLVSPFIAFYLSLIHICVRRKIISKHCVAAPVRRDRQRKNKRHLAF